MRCKNNGGNGLIIPVIGFNSGKYDLNMVKEYFVKNISQNKKDEDVVKTFLLQRKRVTIWF